MTGDHFLLQSIAKKDKNAFKKLYEIFAMDVYNLALNYVQDVHDAEEVTQDVFTNIFRNAEKFKGEASVKTWIYRITINTSLNTIKKRTRNKFLPFLNEENTSPDFDHPGVLLENKEQSKFLFKAIDSLPSNQKTAFILSFIDGTPRQEAADIMEISLKALESLLQRGKKNLRNILEKRYPERRI